MHLTTLVGKAWSRFSRLKVGTQPCERVTEPLSSIKFKNFVAILVNYCFSRTLLRGVT